MRPRERRDLILAEVLSGNGHVESLSDRLGVSASTVRRDLQQLASEGRVTRTYGGAVPGRGGTVEQSLQEKVRTRQAEKSAIAALAASTVRTGETIIINAGTTTGAVSGYLSAQDDLTVVTNGLNTVLSLYERDGFDLLVLGGVVRTVTESMVGAFAENNLQEIFADRVFLGAYGISAEHGISSPTHPQSRLKSLMLKQAREAFVLADHSKLGTAPFPFLTDLSSTHVTLITDSNADPDQIAAFERRRGIDVLIADVPPPSGDVEPAPAGVQAPG